MTTAPLDSRKIHHVSLVHKKTQGTMLWIPYREMTVDPDILISFLLAIIIFRSHQLKTFTKEGYMVVIEEGDAVIGFLIIDRVEDEAPYRESLRTIIERFEEKYEAQLRDWKCDSRLFREFNSDVKEILFGS